MKGVISRLGYLGALLLAACIASAQQGNVPPRTSLILEAAKAKAGGSVAGTVTISFAEGLHGYQNPPSEDYMIPVAVSGSGPTVLVKATYPKGVQKQVGGATKPVSVYEGTIQIPVMVQAPDKAGKHKVELLVGYQQCTDEICFGPAKLVVSAEITVEPNGVVQVAPITAKSIRATVKPSVPKPGPDPEPVKGGGSPPSMGAAEPVEGTRGPKFPVKAGPPAAKVPVEALSPPTGADTPVSSEAPDSLERQDSGATTGSGSESSSESGFVSRLIGDSFRSGNYLLILVASVLIGLALTLTPCVYPMIPVTLSYFSNQVAGSRKGRVGLGFVYMLGIAITYGAIGGAAAALGGSVGSIFQNRWFLIGLAAFMVVLALSMFGLYEIGIPRFLGKHIHGRSGVVGALLMGFLVGIAAAPCAGPLVIAVATKIAEFKSVPFGVLVFTAIGMGLGLPFFALGAFSSGAKAIPKAGAWLTTVKSILGLVVLWIALDYLLKAFPQQVPPDGPQAHLIKAVYLIGAAAYLILVENSGVTRPILAIKGAAILAAGMLAGQALQSRSMVSVNVEWIPFTAASFEAAKRSGKPIVIDASANWCVACHEIDAAVFKKADGVAAMRSVVPLRIDHSTGVDPAYVEQTSKQFGILGLPHIEFLKPGGERVRVIHGKGELGSPEQLRRYLAEIGG